LGLSGSGNADDPGPAVRTESSAFVFSAFGRRYEMSPPKPTRSRPQRRGPETDLGFSWGPRHSLLLALGVGVLVVGFVALSKGSITLAPLLLVFGYIVLIPVSLLLRGRKEGPGE
jgi:hypothetical protein